MPGAGIPSDHGPVNAPPEPLQILRSREYIVLLLLAAAIGVPIAAAAYGFLTLTQWLQTLLFTDLPRAIGLGGGPIWWPFPLLAVAGVLVGLVVRFLPGRGGHSPAGGLHTGAPAPIDLPGVLSAALASLAFGAVIGPEAPLIALGGGLAVAVPVLARRSTPPQTTALIGGVGSFAAVSTLLGSPILGAFLLMEAAGIGGALLDVSLVPGLLAAGIGALIFVGLGAWTGLGTFSLAIPDLPPAGQLNGGEFGWALGIGLAAALIGTAIRRLAQVARPYVERHLVLFTPLVGLLVAGLAVGYSLASGRSSSEVLFSGQTALGPLIAGGAGYSAWTLVLLMVCKGLAYGVSMSGFRGGPIFPALFLGAVGGIALSHLPGLALVPAVGMGMGAMSATMLRLPMTSVLLATLLLLADGLAIMPVVIVAVVVAYVASARLAAREDRRGGPPSREPTADQAARTGSATGP